MQNIAFWSSWFRSATRVEKKCAHKHSSDKKTRTQSAFLPRLPPSVVRFYIATVLDLESLLALMRVCRGSYALIIDEGVWQRVLHRDWSVCKPSLEVDVQETVQALGGWKRAYRSVCSSVAERTFLRVPPQGAQGLKVLYKVVLLGAAASGKSSLMQRASGSSRDVGSFFSPVYLPTIGVDYTSWTGAVGYNHLRLQVWDTSGDQRTRSISTAYIRGCSAAILVYDVGNSESFEQLVAAAQDVRQEEQRSGRTVSLILVGTKADIPSEQRRVSTSKLVLAAGQFKADLFLECSAALDYNVTKLFYQVSRILLRNPPPRPSCAVRV